MSVLKENRSLSKAEFVKESKDIAIRSINLLTRLSARYARVLADEVKSCAVNGFSDCVKANSVYPTSFMRCTMREEYLLRAKANFDSLDAQLSIIYEILRTNPEGAFTDTTGKKALDKKKAEDKLNKMVDILGDAIDREQALIRGQLDYISASRRKIFNTTVGNYLKKGFSRSEAIRMANVEKEVQLQTTEGIKADNKTSAIYSEAIKEEVRQAHEAECAEEITPALPHDVKFQKDTETPVNDISTQDKDNIDTIVPESTQSVEVPEVKQVLDNSDVPFVITSGVDVSGETKRLNEIFGIGQ